MNHTLKQIKQVTQIRY